MALNPPSYITTLTNFGGASSKGGVMQDVALEPFLSALRTNTNIMYRLGKRGTLQKGSGINIRWQFVNQPAAVTANVSAEGGDPAEATITTTAVNALLEEFGAVVPYSRLLISSALSGTKEELLAALGYQAALSVEARCTIEVATASTLTVNAGTAWTADGLRQAAQLLVNLGNVPPPASAPYFAFVGSTEACYDMIGEGAPTWVQAKSRDVESAMLTPLDGTPPTSNVYGCAVKLSQSITRDTTTAPDDDLNFLIAKDAFGISDLDFNASLPQVVDTPPEMSVHVPARNRGYMAWLLFFKAKLARGNSVVICKSDATGT